VTEAGQFQVQLVTGTRAKPTILSRVVGITRGDQLVNGLDFVLGLFGLGGHGPTSGWDSWSAQDNTCGSWC
jgi:hypothetical protein